MNEYQQFLSRKSQLANMAGFEPVWRPEFLFPFQGEPLTYWSIRKGRAAIIADCGIGKTPMYMVWGQNVVQYTNKPVLVVVPLGIIGQTLREAEKFGIDCQKSRDGKFSGKRLIVTNYETLAKFSPGDFSGMICEEASILKNFDGTTKAEIIEFMRTLPYRLLVSATAAPNDYVELGNHAEALGEIGFQDMATKFFKKSTTKDRLGWGRTKYKLRAYAEHDFWRWVCSWARAVRKPSDLGFPDGDFVLPPLTIEEHVITARQKRDGFMIDMPAITLQEQQEERRRTIRERCEKVASLVNHNRPALVWCHLNPEGDLLEKLISGAIQISGLDSDDEKEDKLSAFISGQARVLVSKPQLAGFGLNLQHCAHETFFPSHSWEQWYQCLRRCWRFGQKNPVKADVVTSEGEVGVIANWKIKSDKAEILYDRIVSLMGDSLRIEQTDQHKKTIGAVPWLTSLTRK